jgi:predicted DsbA family dithiol-disulfide isomerase
MPVPMKIDFVSDVSCPWCVIGLKALENALERIGDDIDAHVRFQPFELNPAMPAEGENLVEHVGRKYGSTPEQSAQNRAMIHQRAAELGFTMTTGAESRIYNTFDAHRLLRWAEESGHQQALKHRLFEAYFTHGRNPSDPAVLAEAAGAAGLDAAEARAILASDRYAQEVRAEETLWQSRGINAVPAVVIDERYLISGGQPVEAFERALREIAAEKQAA